MSRQEVFAVGKPAGEQDHAIEHLADFVHQHEWINGASVAAGTGRHRDNAIHACFGRFAGVFLVGDIVEDQAAVTVHCFSHLGGGSQGGDHYGHLVFDAQVQIGLPARVRAMNDEIHGVRRGCLARMGFPEVLQAFVHLNHPFLEAFAGALVQGREAANDALLAAGQRHLRSGDQKHGCRHQRETQRCLQGFR